MNASPRTVGGWSGPVRRIASRLRLKAALYVTEEQMGKGQQTRRTQFALLVPEPNSIVFLGDSITEGGLYGRNGFRANTQSTVGLAGKPLCRC